MQDDLNRLIEELLTRDIRPNIREDLGTFRRELAAGTLAAEDARYIRALHTRVVKGGVPKAEPRSAEAASDPGPSEVERLRAALAESQGKEQALAAERDRLQGELDSLRKEIEALKSSRA